MDSRYKRLGINTWLVFLGSAGGKLIGFLMLPFYTHYLSTVEYGFSDLISTYASILAPIVSCCLADAIFIYPKDANEDSRARYYSSGAGFLLFSFICCSIVFYILYLFGIPSIKDKLWWVYLFTISSYFQSYTQQFTRSIDKMKIYSLTGIVLTVSMAVSAILLTPSYGLNGYLWSIIISNFIAGFFSLFVSKSIKYLSPYKLDKKHLKELLKYGVPLIPNGVMWWIVNGLNRPIMEHELGLSAIGIYAVAGKFPGILNMLFIIFLNAWGISMLEEFNKPDFNQFFNRTVKLLTLAIVLFGSIIIVFSKAIVIVFAAPEYYDAWRYIPILTLSVILQCVSGLIGGCFMAERKSKYFFYSSLWGGICSIVLTLVFIKIWGLIGVPIAVACSFLCMIIIRIRFAWRHINLLEIPYLIKIFAIYTILIAVITMDFGQFYNICSFILAVLLITLISKKEFRSITNFVKVSVLSRLKR